MEVDNEKDGSVDDKFHNILQQFQPFGPENMAPVFMTKRVFDTGSGRVVGNSGEHLKLDLCSEDTGTNSIPSIAFGLGNKYDLVSSGSPVDVAYTVEMNEFKGMRNLQLNIKDIRSSDSKV